MSFQDFGLAEEVVHGVQSMGYSDPTPIQLRAIPLVLEGKDVMGSAQTGTGKTAAFGLPILTKLEKKGEMRCLVLEPTRELAAQVETAFRDFSRFMSVEVGLVHGGVGFGPQREMLKRGVDVLVATPGRLIDYMENNEVDLRTIKYLVLDEVDRMLDMGFLPQVRKIVERCPKDRQTLFFSATLPPEIASMTKWVLKDPEVVEIGQRQMPAETVNHALYPVAKDQKFDLLVALLERTNYDSVIIFCSTKIMADRVAHKLKDMKHAVAVLHADRTQRERMEALDGFKSGRFEVLVATDLAARGLDIQGVSHVVNFDVPSHPEDYVHRIGRTGRAQQVGDAFTIYAAEDLDHVRAIERFIGAAIPRLKLDKFDYLYTALFSESSIPSGGGARGGRTLKGYSFGAAKKTAVARRRLDLSASGRTLLGRSRSRGICPGSDQAGGGCSHVQSRQCTRALRTRPPQRNLRKMCGECAGRSPQVPRAYTSGGLFPRSPSGASGASPAFEDGPFPCAAAASRASN